MSKKTKHLEECPIKSLPSIRPVIGSSGDGQEDHAALWEETFGGEPMAEVVIHHLVLSAEGRRMRSINHAAPRSPSP